MSVNRGGAEDHLIFKGMGGGGAEADPGDKEVNEVASHLHSPIYTHFFDCNQILMTKLISSDVGF